MRYCAMILFGIVVLFEQAQGQLPFQRISGNDGLSNDAITCIHEDRAGFMWIGTESGLNRYDGNVVWQVPGTRDHIAGITEDAEGVLWTATTDHGLLRLDAKTHALTHYRHLDADPRSIATDQLSCVLDLNDTTLLIGSRESTLIFMDKRTRAFSYWVDSLSIDPALAHSQPPSRPSWCHALIPLNDTLLWIGQLNNYTSLIADRRTGKVLRQVVVNRVGSETAVTAVLQQHTLFQGGWQNGIDAISLPDSWCDTERWTPNIRVIDIPDETLALAPWTKGRIIAGTRGSGLLVIDPSTGRIDQYHRQRSDPASLPSDRVRCLLVDHNGTLWVGTAEGLGRHVPSLWRMHSRDLFAGRTDPPELTFHRIDPGNQGAMRVFTSEGFFEIGPLLDTVRHLDVSYHGVKLQPTVEELDHKGGRILGTEYGIVRSSDSGTNDRMPFEPFEIGAQSFVVGNMYQVRGLQPDTVQGKPVFVIATLGFGVHVVDAITRRILGCGMPSVANSARSFSLVNSMVRDARGTYWYGTSGGVLRWDPRKPIIQLVLNGPSMDSSVDVPMKGEDVRQLILRNDTVWGVVRGGALFSIANGTVAMNRPTTELQLALLGLTFDRRGKLWITTDDGLLRFDPTEGTFTRIPVNDGEEFRKLSRAITALSDGRIAFCANNAVITFDPTELEDLPSIPNAYITSIHTAGKSMAIVNGSVELLYRASVIDIGISALSLQQPQPLRFEYRLDGVETEWRTITAREVIRYAGIPVGSHDLLVRLRDAFGRVGAEQLLLTITVVGPIWQQWWFYAIALLLIAAGMYALYRYRLTQALKLQSVRNRIASDLHDEVGSSLSSITIGSQLASKLSTNESEQVKHLMARIGETSSESLRSMSDIVWAIDPKNDQGDALIKRMRRIAQELLASKGIEVPFSISGGVEELKLPMNARKDLLLIYKEAVHNASKYADPRTVAIDLTRVNGSLMLSVKDDGKGFDPTLHPDGHGLGSMQRRGAALGTRVIIQSVAGEGTTVSIRVDLTRIRD